MFNFINFRKLTTTTLLGILMAGNFVIPSASSQDNSPDSVTLTGTLRDFSDQHPDFERNPGDASSDGTVFYYGSDQGITTNSLGLDQKPVYAGGSYSTTNQANFDQWYRNITNINQSKEFAIELTQQSNGVYRYQNTNFFPLNGQLMGNEGRSNNYHFTYELHTRFTYQGGEVFNFSGDDDVWVYINGKKVIDIGGVHGRQDASVSLDDVASNIGLEVGQSYNLDFFFAERHTTQSNFIIETTLELETVPEVEDDDEIVPGQCKNNGHGNNGDIILTLSSGKEILLTKFDPSNPGNGNKITRELEDSNPGITYAEINEAKEIIQSGNYDFERVASSGKDADCDGSIDSAPVDPEDETGGSSSDADNNGILDADELPGDVDGDGIVNYLDLDDDGDNIADVMELHIPSAIKNTGKKQMTIPGTQLTVLLPNPPEENILDSDAINSDGTDKPDYQDTDSDNDTIYDKDEAGDENLESTPAQSDSDDTPDYLDDDSDNDTISDADEAGDSNPNTAPVNTDNDYLPNFIDLDSDSDNISDADEAGDSELATIPDDSDNDSVADYIDEDSDNDYISDKHEAGDDKLATAPVNTDKDFGADGDNVPDYLDDDSDGDSLLDSTEAGDQDLSTSPYNSDNINDQGLIGRDDLGFPSYNDQIPDFLDLDSDDNGILDTDEFTGSIDNDGIDNYRDLDDDGDGIADVIEIGADPANPTNSDNDVNDGEDYQDTNSDNDPWSDSFEGVSTGNGTTPITVTAADGTTTTVNLKNYSEDELVDAVSIQPGEDGKVRITGTPLGYNYQTPTFSD